MYMYLYVYVYVSMCSCWEHLLLVNDSLPSFLEITRKARTVRTPTQVFLSFPQGSLRAVLV